jgi:hypothetical protein
MSSGIRTVQILLGGLCAALGIVVALEMVLPIVNDVTASPAPQRSAVDDPVVQDVGVAPATLDSAIATILQRPLFAADRRPPAPKPASDSDEAAAAPTPPPLPNRLAGVMLGPDGREALFGNPGEKPVAVIVGGSIGGWTVSTIELDRVVLTSAFGDHVLEPTPGLRADAPRPGPKPRVPVPVRQAPQTAQQAQPARVPIPVIQQQQQRLQQHPPAAALSSVNRRAPPRP